MFSQSQMRDDDEDPDDQQRSADCVSLGPMLQGLRKPVNDLPRGAQVDDIVYTIALTAIQASHAAEF